MELYKKYLKIMSRVYVVTFRASIQLYIFHVN